MTWPVKNMREYFRIRKLIRKWDRQTGKFHINIRYKTKTEITPRTIGVAEAFGLGVDEHKEHVIYDNVTIRIGPTDIAYITGESGSGKSVLLKAIEKDLADEAINIDDIPVSPEKPIVETVGHDLNQALELLSRVGLNDAYLFIRRYSQLSDGQRYRYRIAKLIESRKQYWIMDEFCATLDRDTAKIVAFNVQKQARRTGKAVLAATTHTDLFDDLAPSVHIQKGWGKRLEVKYYHNRLNKICSVTHGLRIEEGIMEDYKQLAEFHYRNPDTQPLPLKIFSLRREDGMVVGVIFYSWPPIATSGRRQAIGRALSLEELNKNLATISRVILHPSYRSLGLGVRLVNETLPLVGRPYVEAIAVMARYNPFFEKAGMRKILVTQPQKDVQEAVKDLKTLGFNPVYLSSDGLNLQKLEKLSGDERARLTSILGTLRGPSRRRITSGGKAWYRRAEYEEIINTAASSRLARMLSILAVLNQPKVYLFWKHPNPLKM
jgi:ABC-type transport system involved in cytochrome c biogenesis ATPase subunit/GNAT superfamily N-acetyltransferase